MLHGSDYAQTRISLIGTAHVLLLEFHVTYNRGIMDTRESFDGFSELFN